MFNFQGSELIIILLLALVVLGPEKLPDAMRKLGRFYGDLKRMSTSFQDEFKAAIDEPVRELRDTANTLRDSADFRKLQDGERDEKPKSAEMAPADPTAVPTDDVPFRTPESESPAAADPSTDESSPEASVAPEAPSWVPKPFSASQPSSAAAPAPAETPLEPQTAVDDEHGLREARPVDRVDEDGAA